VGVGLCGCGCGRGNVGGGASLFFVSFYSILIEMKTWVSDF